MDNCLGNYLSQGLISEPNGENPGGGIGSIVEGLVQGLSIVLLSIPRKVILIHRFWKS